MRQVVERERQRNETEVVSLTPIPNHCFLAGKPFDRSPPHPERLFGFGTFGYYPNLSCDTELNAPSLSIDQLALIDKSAS